MPKKSAHRVIPGLFCAQRTLDGFRDFWCIWCRTGAKALQDLPILADQEFPEVPFDIARKRRFFTSEHRVESVAVRAIDFNLVEQRKRDAVFARTKLFDLFVASRLLSAEL